MGLKSSTLKCFRHHGKVEQDSLESKIVSHRSLKGTMRAFGALELFSGKTYFPPIVLLSTYETTVQRVTNGKTGQLPFLAKLISIEKAV